MSKLKVEQFVAKIDELTPTENNPRQISKQDFENLKKSMKEFPEMREIRKVVVDENNRILGGHMRIKALKELGESEVPVDKVYGLTEKQKRRFVVQDNIQNGEWDMDELANSWSDLPLDDWGIATKAPKTYEDGSLGRDFIQVPISVLDATKPSWVARKKVWKQLFSSEKGRGENLLGYRKTICKNNGTSVFDPVLCELMYRWFGVQGGSILDPFCGGSVRGIVAGAMGFQYCGNDLRSEQVEENKRQFELARNYLEIKEPLWSVGDSVDIASIAEDYPTKKFDMIFSCPPYADLEVYSDDPKDISNMKYDDFLKAYREIIAESVKLLEKNRFAVWVVGELRKKDGGFQHFVEDSIKAFEDAGMKYYNHAILVSGAGGAGLRVRRHMRNRKLVHAHQDVLVFKNGEVPDEVEPMEIDKILEEVEKERTLIDNYEDVLVFTNADDIAELRKSFPEIGGNK